MTRIMLAVVIAAIGLCGCRTLTQNEVAFLSPRFALPSEPANPVDLSKVRVRKVDNLPFQAKKRLHQEVERELASGHPRILSDAQINTAINNIAEQKAAAMVFGNLVLYDKDHYKDDFTEGYNNGYIPLDDLTLFSHEIFHVWQGQNRRASGFSFLRVLHEQLKYGPNRYKYVIKEGKPLKDYYIEAQAEIMAHYVCYGLINNDYERDRRGRILEAAFDARALARQIEHRYFLRAKNQDAVNCQALGGKS